MPLCNGKSLQLCHLISSRNTVPIVTINIQAIQMYRNREVDKYK